MIVAREKMIRADRLRDIRKNYWGMEAQEVSDKLSGIGVISAASTIRDYETGRKLLPIDKANAIAKVLDVDIQELTSDLMNLSMIDHDVVVNIANILGKTPQDISEDSGIDFDVIQDLMEGKTTLLSVSDAESLSKALRTPTESLLVTDESEEYPSSLEDLIESNPPIESDNAQEVSAWTIFMRLEALEKTINDFIEDVQRTNEEIIATQQRIEAGLGKSQSLINTINNEAPPWWKRVFGS